MEPTDAIPAIVLFGPLLFPIARQVGVHDVHYAMIVILAMGLGLFPRRSEWDIMRHAPSAASTRMKA